MILQVVIFNFRIRSAQPETFSVRSGPWHVFDTWIFCFAGRKCLEKLTLKNPKRWFTTTYSPNGGFNDDLPYNIAQIVSLMVIPMVESPNKNTSKTKNKLILLPVASKLVCQTIPSTTCRIDPEVSAKFAGRKTKAGKCNLLWADSKHPERPIAGGGPEEGSRLGWKNEKNSLDDKKHQYVKVGWGLMCINVYEINYMSEISETDMSLCHVNIYKVSPCLWHYSLIYPNQLPLLTTSSSGACLKFAIFVFTQVVTAPQGTESWRHLDFEVAKRTSLSRFTRRQPFCHAFPA